jgi:glycosyltransferase involved in cell wall biosynthesis
MNNSEKNASLPRLLYLGDVPVESSYHGSALLYRLLETYPKDRLQVVEAGWHASLPERRLKDVAYHFRSLPLIRLFYSRITRWFVTGNLLLARTRARKFEDLAKAFKPDAVLTVAHGISWITAAALARKLDIPLHLICHDEWADIFPCLPVMRTWKEEVFCEVYQLAASRLCVSPFMIENFAQRYGATGKLLYPSRGVRATAAKVPAQRLSQPRNGLVVAYAGSVYSAEALRLLAECLQPLDGTLLVFAPGSRGQGVFAKLDLPNIRFEGLLESSKLIARLREEADVLFVAMSFLPAHRTNMESCFPSKLTDYTAVGLPILIHSPEYGSAVRWARENPGVAEVVTSAEAGALTEALQRLKAHPEYLVSLAERAIEAGEHFFAHEAAWDIFREALLSVGGDAETDRLVQAAIK